MISQSALLLSQERPAEREMSTDRPDKTESPYSVPAGRWQIEVDALSYSREVAGGVASHSLDIVSTNLKYGLHSRADLQIVMVPLHHEVIRGTPGGQTTGFGEVTGRFKLNLFGNDGGRVAFGLMPFVSVVDGDQGRELQGGLIIPLAVAVAPGWSLGTMAEVDVASVQGFTGRHPVLVHSLTLGRDFGAGVGAYAEVFNELTPVLSSDRWRTTFDLGVTWGVTDDLQLDAGVNYGLTSAAEDVNPFIGFSIRF